ncbi:MAG: hypothetical protein V3T72_11080 [Thermoanaerobaculia bacterium]
MSPLKNDADERQDDIQDAINADPRIDYEPPEGEAQGAGTGEGGDQGG